MKKFWLIWNPAGRSPTFQHDNLNNARIEAERLARQNPGHTFHVLERIGSCKKVDVLWASADQDMDDEIPF